LEDLGVDGKIIRMDLREIGWEGPLDSSGPGYGPVADHMNTVKKLRVP